MLDENKYIENIEYLRAERVEARVQFEKITNCITETMIKLNGKDDKSMITVEDFKSVPLNEMVLLTSKVSFIKILENENELPEPIYKRVVNMVFIHTIVTNIQF
jgi:hypothetical protein